MGRVYVVGLDGVPPALVERGIEAGRLPTFEAMRDGGVSGTTRSTVPPVSMMAWSTFATGQDPGNHGVFNFMLKEPDGYDTSFVDADSLRERSVPVWEYLDLHGVASGVMNVMPGYPVSETDGFHVGDYITTPGGERFAHPPAAERLLTDADERFELDPPTGHTPDDDPDDLRAYVEEFFDVERDRVALTKRLLDEYDTPASFLVFSAPDVFLHEVGYLLDEAHPKYDADLAVALGSAPLDLLATYDDFLAWLRDRMADDDVLLVLSDHGHGPVYTAVNLNSWLYSNGYLELESTLRTRLKAFLFDHVFDATRRVLRRFDLYDDVKHLVARSGSDGGVDLAAALTLSADDVDWRATTAFTVAGDGQVYLNTTDHPAGTVSEDEYDPLRETLRQDLLDIEHPDREGPVIEAVHRGEDVYDGDAPGRPDLVCVPAPTYRLTFPQAMRTSTPFEPPQKWASHTSRRERTGIFYADGDGVASEDDVEMGLADYAPTVLSLLGLPIPKSMDGTSKAAALGLDARPERRAQRDRVLARRAARSVARSLTDG